MAEGSFWAVLTTYCCTIPEELSYLCNLCRVQVSLHVTGSAKLVKKQSGKLRKEKCQWLPPVKPLLFLKVASLLPLQCN